MKIIHKGYAKIFCDDDNDVGTLLDSGMDIKEILDTLVSNDYYSEPGPIQWNCYLLVDQNKIKEEFQHIYQQDKYVRILACDFKTYCNWELIVNMMFVDYEKDNP